MQSNDAQTLVLCVLAGGEKHGYAVNTAIDRMIGYRLGPGSLYGALGRLEAKGLVEALPGEGRQHPYRITAGGRRALEAELAQLTRIVETGSSGLRALSV